VNRNDNTKEFMADALCVSVPEDIRDEVFALLDVEEK
jgi:hypothetical protein